MNNKSWMTIRIAASVAAVALIVLGAILKTQVCADACSLGPRYDLIATGFLIASLALILPARKSRKGWIVLGGFGLFVSLCTFTLGINAWAMIFIFYGLFSLLPVLAIGAIVWAIISAIVKRNR